MAKRKPRHKAPPRRRISFRATWIDFFREIRFTLGRFLSLLIITALGVASVVGIQAAALNMRAVADETFKAQNLYDLQVQSPAGLQQTDLDEMAAAPSVAAVMGTNYYDLFIDVGEETVAARVWEPPDELNQLVLIEGRLPETETECAVEPRLLDAIGGELGSELTLNSAPASNPQLITATSCEIVGVATSPLYISSQRGQTNLGDGSLHYYLVMAPEAFTLPPGFFTIAFVQMQGSATMDQLTDAYNEAAEDWRDDLTATAPADSDWIISTRQEGLAFDSYLQDTRRLEQIGYVFPIVFFSVSALVSLTTMSRMIEEHRTQIGIYKALGYRAATIIGKFLWYALLASVLGTIGGVAIGTWLLPPVITDAYGHLYDFPPPTATIPHGIATIAGAVAVGLVFAVTLIVGLRALSGAPALLMRPKPPAKGRRVLLERVTPLWQRLGFFGKVTARNIFRYKRRFFMTLVGVAGCAALLITAFGLRDSISEIAERQFGEIVNYQARAFLATEPDPAERTEWAADFGDRQLFVDESAATVSVGEEELSAFLLVPQSPAELTEFITMRGPRTGPEFEFEDDSVLVTDKLAEELNLKAGSTFDIRLGTGQDAAVETAQATVTHVVENFVGNYVYLSPETFRSLFDEEPSFTNVLVQTTDPSGTSARLLEEPNVIAALNLLDQRAQLADTTDAMAVVTIVLVVLACALALVVLFNLTNINILERTRELATLKVLGFNQFELAMYVYRENALVIVLGILLGLISGYFLHGFVLTTVELDAVRFPHLIKPGSYLLSIALTALFAIFVNLIMNRKLKNIDMVESLKAVE